MSAAAFADDAEYRSPLANWHTRATVRRSPQHRLECQDVHRVYFPPDLEPVVGHPLVARLGPAARHQILIERLHQYMSFTVELEATTVVPVTTAIARGRSGLDLPVQMRADAFKITTDEAWHAQFSYDLMAQVAQATGVAVQAMPAPAFARRLARSARRVPAGMRAVHGLLAAVASETLISALLADLPHDPRLPAAVRAVVADHAEDEGRHHAYFRTLLRYLWPALEPAGRRSLGPLVPGLVVAFLEPDYAATRATLMRAGLTEDAASQVLAETYPPQVVRGFVAKAARPTVRYFADAGAFADAGTYAAFAAEGLLEDA